MVISSWGPPFCQKTKLNFQRLSVRIVRPVHTHFRTFTLEGGTFVLKMVWWGFKIFQTSINIQNRPCDKDKEHISVSANFFTVKKKFCTAWPTKVVLNMEGVKNDYFLRQFTMKDSPRCCDHSISQSESSSYKFITRDIDIDSACHTEIYTGLEKCCFFDQIIIVVKLVFSAKRGVEQICYCNFISTEVDTTCLHWGMGPCLTQYCSHGPVKKRHRCLITLTLHLLLLCQPQLWQQVMHNCCFHMVIRIAI